MNPASSARVLAVFLALTLSLAACASTSHSSGSSSAAAKGSSSSIVIGASDSLTGALSTLGVPEEAGQKQAVADINAAGGLLIGGKRHPVKLTVLDNRSDPTTASQQTRDLVLQDGAIALLGGCTPPITVPEGLAAEQLRVPFITSCTPIGAFAAGNKAGWKYSFDLFFSEQDQARSAVAASNLAPSNKKVAVFTDNEPDGVVERPLYIAAARAAGDQVVGDYSFPVGTTDFTSFINDAKAKDAQLVICQMTPPDGVTLWKQMKSLGFHPVTAFAAKAADNSGWVKALGPLSNGTLLETFWSPAEHNPETSHLEATLGKRFDFSDLNAAILGYTPAYVLFKAMSKANSISASRVVAALQSNTFDSSLGEIRFSSQHTAATPYFVSQWQGDEVVQIYPPVTGAKLAWPVAGLQ